MKYSNPIIVNSICKSVFLIICIACSCERKLDRYNFVNQKRCRIVKQLLQIHLSEYAQLPRGLNELKTLALSLNIPLEDFEESLLAYNSSGDQQNWLYSPSSNYTLIAPNSLNGSTRLALRRHEDELTVEYIPE